MEIRKSMKRLKSQANEKPLTVSCQVIKSIHDLNLWFMLAAECCHFVQHQSGVTCRMIYRRNSGNKKRRKFCEHKATINRIQFHLDFPAVFFESHMTSCFRQCLMTTNTTYFDVAPFNIILMFCCIINQTTPNYLNVQVGDENYAIKSFVAVVDGEKWRISSWTIYWRQLKLVVATVKTCNDHDKSNHCSNQLKRTKMQHHQNCGQGCRL